MKSNVRVMMVIAILALAALACQAVTGGGDSGNDDPPFIYSTSSAATDEPTIDEPATEEPALIPTEPEAPVAGDVVFSDDFSVDQWGTGTDADSAVEYLNEALNFIVFKDNFFVWSTPDDEVYENIHMEVTVINNGTDATTAFGLMCNKAVVNDFYYLAITPSGQYAIAKAVTAQTDVFLTNNDEWADSDLIAINADSYRVSVDCGNGALTLYVDGQEIASVNDSSYTNGRVAVFAWSGEEVGITTDVSFDDFEMTELP